MPFLRAKAYRRRVDTDMETTFLSPLDKGKLMTRIENGDKEALDQLIREMDRLESLVKDYELGIRIIKDKFESRISKSPAKVD